MSSTNGNGNGNGGKVRGIPAQMKLLNGRVADVEKRLDILSTDVASDIAALEARLAVHELAMAELARRGPAKT